MKKLRLSPDQLRVDAFATTPAAEGGRGTVRGHSLLTRTCGFSCDPRESCAQITADDPTCSPDAC